MTLAPVEHPNFRPNAIPWQHLRNCTLSSRDHLPDDFSPLRGRYRCIAGRNSENTVMPLIAIFVTMVLIGDSIAIGICSIVERFSEMGSLILFLTMFAGIIPIAWRTAVQLTEPTGLLTRFLSTSHPPDDH